MLNQFQIDYLTARYNRTQAAHPDNIRLLGGLPRTDRETFAKKTRTCVLYVGEEVAEAKKAEEDAALKAVPSRHQLSALNGLNIGCGDRAISPYLTAVDIFRAAGASEARGMHHAFIPSAVLALPDRLPFRDESIDYIVALHMLEHVPNPVEVIHHWLDVLKPGGGIGIVVPRWEFTWDSRRDNAPLGHKWNCSPALIRRLYAEHWSERCNLESIETYDFKISFDFVLRKNGTFTPFSAPDPSTMETGYSLSEQGRFLG